LRALFVEPPLPKPPPAPKSNGTAWNRWNTPLRWPARILGIVVVAIFIASMELHIRQLDPASKCLYWTGCVFVPLLVLNRDLYKDTYAWLITLVLVGIQGIFIKLFWGQLGSWNVIELTPLCITQMMLFVIPFLMLRRYRGITYPMDRSKR
jgi:hypothetical protein